LLLEIGMPTFTDLFAKALGIDEAVAARVQELLSAKQPLRSKPDLLFTLPGLNEFAAALGLIFHRTMELPPSKGYEPFLLANGYNEISARGMAHLARRSGKRQASEAKRIRPVYDAIRFLAKTRRKGAILYRAKLLLAASNETSIIETIFDQIGLHEAEFIGLLEAIVGKNAGDHERLTEIAAQVAPHLALPRGPKVSQPSASHAFVVDGGVKLENRRRPHSRKDRTAENCDTLTEATRTEFNQPNFDSRPAKRRLKRSQRVANRSVQQAGEN
jgi:hypothetical protein